MILRFSRSLALYFCLVLLLMGCNNNHETSDKVELQFNEALVISFFLTNSLPHDTTSFTEGLLFHKGKLYESTGSPTDLKQTKSLFGVVDLTTGKIDKKVELDRNRYFGEGIAFLNNRAYQLTYKDQKGFIYDSETFKKVGEFGFANKEGWGLTADDTCLIMSDGTERLTYLDPKTFEIVKTLEVTKLNTPVSNLNELEYINGFIFSNVFMTNTIIKIDPKTGKVVGEMDLSSLFEKARRAYRGSMEMNGIAFNKETGKVYITGKLWPLIFEIELVEH